MAKPEKMILVCNNQRPPGHPRGCCMEKSSRDITMELSEALDDRNLFGKVSLASTGCLGPCALGPLVIVQPDNTWYKEVTKENLQLIIDEHIVGGNVVEKLAMTDADWE